MYERQITAAGEHVEEAIEEVVSSHKRIAKLARKTRVAVGQVLALPDEERAAFERVKGLQLRAKMLDNMRKNWPVWKRRNKHVDIRINQLKGLEQLVYFLRDDEYEFVFDQSDTSRSAPQDQDEQDNNPLVGHYVQPTGAGKTGLFSIEVALTDVKTLVLVPFDNLMYQTEGDLRGIGGIPEDDIGVLCAGCPRDLYLRKVMVSTYAGHLARMKRDPEYRKIVQEECELVVCDEGHMALGARTQESIGDIDEMAKEEMTTVEYDAQREVLEGNGLFVPSKAVKIAFTATPKLAAKHVRQRFGRCIGRIYQAELVQAGINVPYTIIQTDGTILEGDQILDKMSEGEEVKILNRENVYAKLLTEYAAAIKTYDDLKAGKKRHKEKPMPVYGMAFCTNHAECEKFVKDAAKLDLKFEILTGRELARGQEGREQLQAAEGRLLRHEIDGFVTVEKLATGYSPNFMNTILWARVTSSARTVQAIGRGGRRHTYPGGIPKTDCAVIETNWSLSRKAKKGKKLPMRFADALHDQGESPEKICSMANGEAIDVRRIYRLQEDGTINVGGRLAIGIILYAQNQSPKMDIGLMYALIKEARLQPVADVKVARGSQMIEVFWKDEVDPLLPLRLDEEGVVLVGGRYAIGVSAYAAAQKPKIDAKSLQKQIEAAGIKKVENIRVRGKIDIYWKDEVDPLIPKRLNNLGVVTLGDREAVGVNAYVKAQLPGLATQTLFGYIKEAGVKPVSGIRVHNEDAPIEVYWKDEVDALLPKRLDNRGIVEIQGRQAIGVKAYSASFPNGPSKSTLMDYIKAAGLKPAETEERILSGSHTIEVYWKNEVDAVLKQKGRL